MQAPVLSGVFLFIFTAMELPIFFHSDFITDGLYSLNEDTSKHVVQVLRMKQGEEFN